MGRRSKTPLLAHHRTRDSLKTYSAGTEPCVSMAEAVAVIGLAASITTLADVCTKVLARLSEFQPAAGGAHGAFRDIAIQLPLIVGIVSQIGKGCGDGSLVVDVQQKLIPVVEGCRRHVDALDGPVEKVLPAPADYDLPGPESYREPSQREGDFQGTGCPGGVQVNSHALHCHGDLKMASCYDS
jgi:N-terminal domain on NACHT_NTPase and P-loop NTPases